jgi:hypothetical protein
MAILDSDFCSGICCICGGQSVACWAGKQMLEVCYHCAVNVLPKLIADAVVGKDSVDVRVPKSRAEEVLANYWYGVAWAISRNAAPQDMRLFMR